MKKYIALGALLAGCGGDAAVGTGTVNVAIWGEEYIESTAGIPAMMGSTVGFVDGWSVRFTKFLVSVGQVSVNSTGGTANTLPPLRVYNLHGTSGPVRIGSLPNVPARRQDLVGYRIAPPTADSTPGNSGATASDITAMRSGGFSLWVEGTATKPGRATPITFRWTFGNTVDYTRCELEGAFGVAVPSGGTADVQLTIHGDHFFYDRVGADAQLRFEDIAAADRNMDNMVTLEELAMVDLTTLPRDRYDPSGAPNVNTLRDFMGVLSTTVGHYNGEGECTVTRR